MTSRQHPSRCRPALSPWALAVLVLASLPFQVMPKSAAGAENFFTHLHTEKVMANVTVSPGHAGSVQIAIQLETVEERPLTAKGVSVMLTDTQSGEKFETVQALRTGDDGWLVKIPKLTAGRWMLGLDISISDADTVKVEAPILISLDGVKGEGDAVKHHHH